MPSRPFSYATVPGVGALTAVLAVPLGKHHGARRSPTVTVTAAKTAG
jgi:hypothetical protein